MQQPRNCPYPQGVHSPSRTLARERLRVIAIIALAFLPLVLIETAIIGQQAQAGRENIQAGRLALVRSAAGAADGFVTGNLATLHALTQTRSIKGADADTVNSILRPIIQNDSNWLTIALSAADGWNLSSLTTTFKRRSPATTGSAPSWSLAAR